MLTKGYIVELSTSTSNKFKVRIPLFDSAGQDTLTNSDNVVEATLCYEPSNLDSYEVGDCVFIEFENDEESKPVIIGKLYTTDSKENRGFGNLSTLNVSSSASLPLDSTLGDVKLQTIIDNLKLSQANSDRIDQISTGDVSQLTKQVNANTSNIATINETIKTTGGTSKGYVYNRDDGVSEMGQYIDFHYNKSSQDYSTRISTQATTNGNVLTLPTTSGTLSTQEYVNECVTTINNSISSLTNNVLFERSFAGLQTLKITQTARTKGCLIEVILFNPNDVIFIYGVRNNVIDIIFPSKTIGKIMLNCGNGGRVYGWGYDIENNVYTNTNGTVYSDIYIYGQYYCIKVMNGCLDDYKVKYSSFDEVLEEAALPSSLTLGSDTYSIHSLKSSDNTFSGVNNFTKTLKYNNVEVATKDDIANAITNVLNTSV